MSLVLPPLHALWCWFPPPARFARPRVAGPKQKLSAESRVGMFSFGFCGHVLQSQPDHGGARPCLSPAAAFPPAMTRSRARSCPSDIRVPLLACPFLRELFSWRAGSSFLQFTLCAGSGGQPPQCFRCSQPWSAHSFPPSLPLPRTSVPWNSVQQCLFQEAPLGPQLPHVGAGLVSSSAAMVRCICLCRSCCHPSHHDVGDGLFPPQSVHMGGPPCDSEWARASPATCCCVVPGPGGLGPRGAVQCVPQLQPCPCPTLPTSPDLCRFRRS